MSQPYQKPGQLSVTYTLYRNRKKLTSGGSAANLNDLLDVSVGSATAGAFLQLQSNGQWSDTYGLDCGEY